MPFIPVQATAQAKLFGTVSGHPFNCIWHFRLPTVSATWTTAQLNALCDGLMNGLKLANGVQSLTGVNVTFSGVTAVGLETSAPAVGNSSVAAFSGSLAGTDLPPSVSILVQFVINDRFRGGHPRTYMPPSVVGSLVGSEDSWTPTFITSYNTAFINMIDNGLAANTGSFQCTPRYNYTFTDVPAKHKWLKTKSSLLDNPQVVNWVVKANIAGQSRRAKIGG